MFVRCVCHFTLLRREVKLNLFGLVPVKINHGKIWIVGIGYVKEISDRRLNNLFIHHWHEIWKNVDFSIGTIYYDDRRWGIVVIDVPNRIGETTSARRVTNTLIDPVQDYSDRVASSFNVNEHAPVHICQLC